MAGMLGPPRQKRASYRPTVKLLSYCSVYGCSPFSCEGIIVPLFLPQHQQSRSMKSPSPPCPTTTTDSCFLFPPFSGSQTPTEELRGRETTRGGGGGGHCNSTATNAAGTHEGEKKRSNFEVPDGDLPTFPFLYKRKIHPQCDPMFKTYS